ncbi:VOC family protein [Sphingomonas sp. BIUV-7]|uniref:VOC family protein n=1 Tax=Sphingomonas natans TaxID=3063330 RepID=A0ABT8YB62_9SPHN|nr:VOC family protein [Sphingomonas sp. BIUV-7]MDO6415566.1 VOC family protein [Sphingomonas sp. BIUV-7]
MRVVRLGHVNIRTPAFDETIAFYETCLGLRAGPAVSSVARPQNVWLHNEAGDPIIHVNGPMGDEAVYPEGAGSRLDHFALDCTGLDACIARLEANGVPFQRIRLEARGMSQLNLFDPNGLKVELTFSDRDEGLPARAG